MQTDLNLEEKLEIFSENPDKTENPGQLTCQLHGGLWPTGLSRCTACLPQAGIPRNGTRPDGTVPAGPKDSFGAGIPGAGRPAVVERDSLS